MIYTTGTNSLDNLNTNHKLSETKLQKLHNQVDELMTYHKAILETEEVVNDLKRFEEWIEKCENGSISCEIKLCNEGIKIIEDIKSRLHLALEEQQHIIEESPAVANNARGRRAEGYAKVSSIANEILADLIEISEKTKS